MPIPFPARILIADDHAVVREGLRALMEREPDLQVVAEAADGLAAVQMATTEDLHLAILDVAMPGITGLQAAREISRRRDIPILILSMYDREQYFFGRSPPARPATS
jgi:DNA-binding NarL/FixJ family response regulator